MQLKHDQLTSQSRANKALFRGGITLPLLAALPWHLDPSWHGAVGTGQPHVHGAKRYTAHCSIQTGTLVLAATLESLATLVHHASKHTGGSILSCGIGGRKQEEGHNSAHEGHLFTLIFRLLTCAHSYASVDGCSEVTVQAFVRVTDIFLGAQLPHLFGAHPAAAAAIQNQAHSWGALWRGGGTRTLAAALLSCCLST